METKLTFFALLVILSSTSSYCSNNGEWFNDRILHHENHANREEKLVKFLQAELDSLDAIIGDDLRCESHDSDLSCTDRSHSISKRVDLLATRLNERLSKEDNEDIYEGMKSALKFDNLGELESKVTIENDPQTKFQQPKGLMDAVDEEVDNPNVLHRKHKVNFENLRSETLKYYESMTENERRFLLEAFSDVHLPNGVVLNNGQEDLSTKKSFFSLFNKISEHKPKVVNFAAFIGNLIESFAEMGFKLFDAMEMAPEFVDKIPIVGEVMLELRRKGEPLFMAVRLIRSVHYILKLSPKGANLAISDKMKLSESRRIISQVGLQALKKVAAKMITHFGRKLSPDEMKEFESRAANTLLVVAASNMVDKAGK